MDGINVKPLNNEIYRLRSKLAEKTAQVVALNEKICDNRKMRLEKKE